MMHPNVESREGRRKAVPGKLAPELWLIGIIYVGTWLSAIFAFVAWP